MDIILRRTKERILHFFEQHPPPSKESRSQGNVCITEFSRSAAGMRTPKSLDLRTTKALKRTVEYLLDRFVLVKLMKGIIFTEY